MKYILHDKNTGNFVRNVHDGEFTRNIYDAALFANEKKAKTALQKFYYDDGSLVQAFYVLCLGKPTDYENTVVYWTSKELRDQFAERYENSDLESHKGQAEKLRSQEVKVYDLEVRGVEFTLLTKG